MAGAPAASSIATAHPRATVCRNCGAAVSRNFCPECGQDTSLHPLSVWEFVQEILSHYVAAEGKLWRTLASLALHPGQLTIDYLAGRRQRYIIPLRLYLTASFVFFALSQLSAHHGEAPVHIRINLGNSSASAPADGPAPPPAPKHPGGGGSVLLVGPPDRQTLDAMAAERFEDCGKPDSQCSTVKRLIAPAVIKLQADPEGMSERFGERFQHSVTYAMFLLLPIFALLLAAAYHRRRLYYGEHLVFALHVHSFWFLLAVLGLVLPPVLAGGVPLGFVIYGFSAMQRVYGGRWWATALRGTTVLATYALVTAAGAIALSVALLATT